MLGAIAGDIIGSVYEHAPIKSKDFPLFKAGSRFTDDTVMTMAVARALLSDRDYGAAMRELGRRYPGAGYGASFFRWLQAERPRPYQSWGNGAAMRVSPVGFALASVEEVLREAARSAAVSHDHPEGIKGAQAAALAVYLARVSRDKAILREEIAGRFGYDLNRTLAAIRPGYRFDVSCQGTVPEAIIAFIEADSYEDTVRNAISLGGDSDTLACIAGGIAEAFYGPPAAAIRAEVQARLPPDLLAIITQFHRRFQPQEE